MTVTVIVIHVLIMDMTMIAMITTILAAIQKATDHLPGRTEGEGEIIRAS